LITNCRSIIKLLKTKKCKTEKLKGKTAMLISNSKSLGNHVVGLVLKKKQKGYVGFAERKVLSLE